MSKTGVYSNIALKCALEILYDKDSTNILHGAKSNNTNIFINEYIQNSTDISEFTWEDTIIYEDIQLDTTKTITIKDLKTVTQYHNFSPYQDDIKMLSLNGISLDNMGINTNFTDLTPLQKELHLYLTKHNFFNDSKVELNKNVSQETNEESETDVKTDIVGVKYIYGKLDLEKLKTDISNNSNDIILYKCGTPDNNIIYVNIIDSTCINQEYVPIIIFEKYNNWNIREQHNNEFKEPKLNKLIESLS